ncbi:hypothetical protein RJI07_08300 [Mycoplasmatota bacterium WC30]
MKKRLYDFTTSNAVIFILAYAMLLTLNIFSVSRNNWENLSGILFLIFLLVSLVAIITYFVFMAISIDETAIKHRRKQILKKDLDVYVRPNYRLKYNEIIFRDKNIDYEILSKKQIRKNEIAIQYFDKYEFYLLSYLDIEELKQWSNEYESKERKK